MAKVITVEKVWVPKSIDWRCGLTKYQCGECKGSWVETFSNDGEFPIAFKYCPHCGEELKNEPSNHS